MGGGYYSDEAFEQAQASADELVADAERFARERDRDIEIATEVGRPASTIVEYAEAHDVDLVVVGSHGRTGLSRFLLGSVAEAVATRSPVSVTIIREAGS